MCLGQEAGCIKGIGTWVRINVSVSVPVAAERRCLKTKTPVPFEMMAYFERSAVEFKVVRCSLERWRLSASRGSDQRGARTSGTKQTPKKGGGTPSGVVL